MILPTNNQKQATSAFTLIELLVVLVIISLLSSVVLASLSQMRANTRDAERVNDFQQLHTAIDLYLAENDEYPGKWLEDGQISENCKTTEIYNDLVGDGYLPLMPTDPSENYVNCGNSSGASADHFLYTFDIRNYGGDVCVGINNFETNDDGGEISEYNQVGDRSFGGEGNLTQAEFVHCFEEDGHF